MDKEIIKTGLLNPTIIPDILESDLLEYKNADKLKRIYDTSLRNKAMPSNTVLNKVFKFDIEDTNEADVDVVYQLLNELNIIKYMDEVHNFAHKFGREVTPEDVYALEKKHLKKYGEKTENRFTLNCKADLLKLKKAIDAREEEFIATGYNAINNLTKGNNLKLIGGWRPGSLYSIMGLSGYGKSIFLTNFARDSWSLGNKVLYISTEMDHLQTFERILKSYYKIDRFVDIIAVNKLFPKGRIEVVKVHPNDTTYLDIQNIIDQLDWTPDVLFIDYADELKSHEKTNNEYEAQGVVYSGLKKLAEMNNLPIITATQTNRAAEDSERGGTKSWVGMGAIADSTKKIRLVDMLFSITQSVEDKVNNVLNLLVIKNRFGKSNIKIRFKIDYQKMLLTELKDKSTPSIENEVSPPILPQTIELNKKGKI